jgi:transcription initiation factor TFIIIB Brf1 subunit/transcription initiation factor TFIIB
MKCPICEKKEFEKILSSANAWSNNAELNICTHCGTVNGLDYVKKLESTRAREDKIKKLKKEIEDA